MHVSDWRDFCMFSRSALAFACAFSCFALSFADLAFAFNLFTRCSSALGWISSNRMLDSLLLFVFTKCFRSSQL